MSKIMCIIKQLALLSTVLSYSSLLNAPSYIKPCKLSDKEFEKCALSTTSTILEHFVKGDEALRVAPISVYTFPTVNYEYGDDFSIIFVNPLIYGLKNLKPTLIQKVPNQNKIVAVLTTDRIDVVGAVSLDVNVNHRHILNHGFGNISFINTVYKYNFTWETQEHEGLKYAQLTDEEQDVEFEMVVHNIRFIGANVETDAEINQYLNENSEEIIRKTRPSIRMYMQEAFHSLTDTMFTKIPYDMLFLE